MFKCHDLFRPNNGVAMLSQIVEKEVNVLYLFPRVEEVRLHLWNIFEHENSLKNGGKEDG